ncbi:VanW family protein [Paraclostridium bifermentans]|uniref:VanW family protein n=1 Tax=Paraclostridium bifermentans TaxID=1490 RepID=UPI00359C1FE5
MKRHGLYFLIIVILICFGLIGKSYALGKDDRIYKNIYIENIDVSGLTKEEAINKIEKHIYGEGKITLKYKDKTYNLNLRNINLNYNINSIVGEALKLDKNSNLIDNIKSKLKLSFGEKFNFILKVSYDKEKLNSYIDDISKNINTNPINASISVNKDTNEFSVSKEKIGIYVDKDKLIRIIDNKINIRDYSDENIPIYNIEPKYTFKKLSKINSVLGIYETKFNPKNYNRVDNIRLAADKINNTIIDSKEKFSFNKIIGDRSLKQGFKEAPVIINGEMKEGLGGGVCQVSSTVYNAALYSGLEIVQVKNHSIPSGYIDKGRDATVSYGSIDLVFRNNYNHPILIKHFIEENKLISIIYGNDKDKRNIGIETELVEVIPKRIIIKNSEDLMLGKRKIEDKGRDGYKVNTYRVYKNNEIVERKELINESYYPPKEKILLIGIDKKEIK